MSDLTNIVNSDHPLQIKRFPILHIFGSSVFYKENIGDQDSDHREWGSKERPLVNEGIVALLRGDVKFSKRGQHFWTVCTGWSSREN